MKLRTFILILITHLFAIPLFPGNSELLELYQKICIKIECSQEIIAPENVQSHLQKYLPNKLIIPSFFNQLFFISQAPFNEYQSAFIANYHTFLQINHFYLFLNFL